jgi:5-methylcytosine-specific restriction endonuclease McrA
VRINSTGKALTKQEKRNAKYSKSPFLKEAWRLAKRYEQYFLDNGILTAGTISRMKHVELICELMLSLYQGDVLNKKTALDRVMKADGFDGRQLGKASGMVVSALNRVRRMFPNLKSTRLRQLTDFYTLAVLIGKFEQSGLILTNNRHNRLAWDLLKEFAAKVDEVRMLRKDIKGSAPHQALYREYLLTVSQTTDDIAQRRKREAIVSNLIRSLFEKKDTQRGFSDEQRRIMWNTAASRTCTYAGCRTKLTWDDFTIDHIDPHSRGGKSKLNNAALMCRRHNSSKGNRRG